MSIIVVGIILILSYIVLVGSTIFTIIADKGDPVKSLSWIVVIVLLPIFGFIIYIIFGQNFRKIKIFRRKTEDDNSQTDYLLAQQRYEINSLFGTQKGEVLQNRDTITLLLNNNKSQLTYNNRVSVLFNGDNTFASILNALAQAKSFIHLEYYMVIDDTIGNRIANVLIDKAEQGVEVRFIYDDVGSWSLPKSYVNRLREAGVKVYPFMRVRYPLLTSKLNYRNHRKIIVIDGKVGFTGGVNIADKYIYGTSYLGSWHDTHLKVEGDAVMALQLIFANDWNFVCGESLDQADKYFPKNEARGDVPMQIASSGPDSDWASIMQGYFSAITKAKSHIYIATPYFLPNESILTAIKVASLSGLNVSIMLPNRSDSKIVYWATRSYIGELLDAGVNIYLYEAGFIHSKVIIIDGVFSSVGSANMDIRSFEDNFEVSAMMYDEQITKQLEDMFLNDITGSIHVSADSWSRRSKLHSFYESISRLWSPLL